MKFKSFLASHKLLVKDVVTSACLVGGTAGIVFGISAGTFKVEYMDLSNAQKRLYASEHNSYLSQDIISGWNMTVRPDGDTSAHYIDMPGRTSAETPWKNWHKDASGTPFATPEMSMSTPEGTEIGATAKAARKEYNSIIIDGATHNVMDRSFNQSMFEGFADFNSNTKNSNYDISNANSYKPSQDNTTDFINTYTSIMKKHKVLGLAGFNHATPLTAMMTHKKLADGFDDPYATCANADDTKVAESTAFILLDANIPNNQNIASVQFRADQPGFLTGLATCSYLIHNLNLYHDHYQDISVACYGGVPIPTVTVYMGGFQRGVELYNYTVIYNCVGLEDECGLGASTYFGREPASDEPNAFKCKETFEILKDHSKYKEDIEEIYNDGTKSVDEKIAAYIEQGLPTKLYDEFSIKMIKLGDLSNHFSGTFAAGDAVGITKQYLNRGASAIIAVAGPQSLDTAQEIQNQNSKTIVIGVDTAMESGDYQRYHNGFSKNSNPQEKSSDGYWDSFTDKEGNHSSESHAIIKFSAIKDLKVVTEKITRLIANGENWDVTTASGKPDRQRAICGVGFQTCANILNGLVSISWDGFVPLIDALEHFAFWNNTNNVLSLSQAWGFATENYVRLIGDDEWKKLPLDYRNAVWDIDKICTYKRYNSDGSENSLYQNYNHTMGILGQLLNSYLMRFTQLTSLRPKSYSDLSKGFEIIPEDDTEYYTILDWLRYNMYLTC